MTKPFVRISDVLRAWHSWPDAGGLTLGRLTIFDTPREVGAFACPNQVSDDVAADLDPALQSRIRHLSLEPGDPGTPVLDPASQHLI